LFVYLISQQWTAIAGGDFEGYPDGIHLPSYTNTEQYMKKNCVMLGIYGGEAVSEKSIIQMASIWPENDKYAVKYAMSNSLTAGVRSKRKDCDANPKGMFNTDAEYTGIFCKSYLVQQ
tara:strand:- start:73 stop:426 length:354 start_codon:yes stop_codon:yes gene_type:complete